MKRSRSLISACCHCETISLVFWSSARLDTVCKSDLVLKLHHQLFLLTDGPLSLKFSSLNLYFVFSKMTFSPHSMSLTVMSISTKQM